MNAFGQIITSFFCVIAVGLGAIAMIAFAIWLWKSVLFKKDNEYYIVTTRKKVNGEINTKITAKNNKVEFIPFGSQVTTCVTMQNRNDKPITLSVTNDEDGELTVESTIFLYSIDWYIPLENALEVFGKMEINEDLIESTVRFAIDTAEEPDCQLIKSKIQLTLEEAFPGIEFTIKSKALKNTFEKKIAFPVSDEEINTKGKKKAKKGTK